MIIKRYIVKNMNEAMTRIRYELGKDAVIISQRKIRKPGILGFFSKPVIEVTAAAENVKKVSNENIQQSIETIKKIIDKDTAAENTNKTSTPTVPANVENKAVGTDMEVAVQNQKKTDNETAVDLVKEMQEMKNLIASMAGNTSEKSTRRSKLQIRLEENDINDKVIKKILTKLKTIEADTDDFGKARIVIEKMIGLSKAKMEGTVVLVGPTGVGKTTTIAKLSGRLSLIEKKKVGLITIDTYRIGAVDQLRTYAEIMNIPFKVVLTIKDMEAALQSMSHCDVVLVDTTGRSSKNTMQISELRAFIDKTKSDNIHLVVSSTTKDKDLEAVVDGFKVLNYKNVIITKLDETSTYGSILNILDYAKKPLSFVTTGQNVPDDIKQLSSKELTNLILGEDTIC